MDLTQLIGNAPLKRQLEGQTARRGLSHAYVVSGPSGSGKRTLARLLAAAMVCSHGDEPCKPCRHCPGCKKALAGIHPDIQTVGDDGKDITVAQVRALRSDAYIRPNEAPRKVYLIEYAQTMNQSAQNALLKLLEEGPAYAAFLLLTENAAALLQTVRSRCESLSLSPVTQQEALDWLRTRYPDKPSSLLERAALRCEGLLGRAVDELEEHAQSDSQAREGAAELVRRLCGGDELALAEYCVSLERWDRDSLSSLMDETVLLARDALLLQSGVSCAEADPERRSAASDAAGRLSGRALMDLVAVCERLRTACGFNTGAGHITGWLCAALSGSN